MLGQWLPETRGLVKGTMLPAPLSSFLPELPLVDCKSLPNLGMPEQDPLSLREESGLAPILHAPDQAQGPS